MAFSILGLTSGWRAKSGPKYSKYSWYGSSLGGVRLQVPYTRYLGRSSSQRMLVS